MRAANVRLALPVRSLATRSGRPIHGKKDGPTIMRARAGDPPRTMPQKILAGRASDPQLRGDVVLVKVDQVILSRAPSRALAEALAAGMKKTPVEAAVAYDGTCVTDAASLGDIEDGGPHSVSPDFPTHNIPIARPGIGFPGPVHLERFAAP